jgi:hypothetical protein
MKLKTRGIEPIIAAVLLIVVAVIGAVLVYLWFAGYITRATSQAEQISASEKLKIEAASLTTTGSVTLHVRNLGSDTARIVHIYILKAGSITPVCSQSLSSPVVINPGSVESFTRTVSPCTLDAGFDYVVKIVTQRGTEFAVTVTAASAS